MDRVEKLSPRDIIAVEQRCRKKKAADSENHG